MPRKTKEPKERLEEKLNKPEKKSALKVAKKSKETKGTSAHTESKKTKASSKPTKNTKTAKTKKAVTSANNKIKASTSKSTTSKNKKETTTSKTKSTSKKFVSKEGTSILSPFGVEYYDLPLRYNQTVVKILYQNTTTMFVYWEISDKDRINFEEIYGNDFFNTTRPFLVVYNDTMNYHFEIEINDFANSWYFNISDSNCNYRIELIRKPINYNENIKTESIFISSSNKIESPNDKILFSTDEPNTVYFRNTKNNIQRKIDLSKLLQDLNMLNKKFNFPLVNNIYDLYKFIYDTDDAYTIYSDLANPSSGNPSSSSFASQFK